MGTVHNQIRIRAGQQSAEVDEELAPLMRLLWRAGFHTMRSCQEHMSGKVWIEFADPQAASVFIDVVVPPVDEPDSMWRRAKAWGFGMMGNRSEPIGTGVSASDAWEYHVTVSDNSYFDAEGRFVSPHRPNFSFGISVLFPRSDLESVVSRMRACLATHANAKRARRRPNNR